MNETSDLRVLRYMKSLRRQGYANANVGKVARHFLADPVSVLGAMERVKGAYRKWVNAEEADNSTCPHPEVHSPENSPCQWCGK